jgi:hypothetical protein
MEGLACIVGLLNWPRLLPSFWKYFVIYLGIICCCEFIGWYMVNQHIKGSTLMYNYFVIPLEFLFMHFLYYKNLPMRFQKTILVLSTFYTLSWMVEQLFLKEVKWIWLSMSYSVGNITILVLGIIYFLQLLEAEELISYKKQMFFWVNLGLMLFYIGTFPYFAMKKTLYETEPNLFKILSWITVFLNYAMYSFFIIGFLCTNIKQK